MVPDASPTIGLVVALIAGVFVGLDNPRGVRWGALWGAVACALFFIVWHLVGTVPSLTGNYAIGVGLLAIMSVPQGLVWGGLWGAVGGWLGRKMGGDPPRVAK